MDNEEGIQCYRFKNGSNAYKESTHLFEVGTVVTNVYTALLLCPFENIVGGICTELLVRRYISWPHVQLEHKNANLALLRAHTLHPLG